MEVMLCMTGPDVALGTARPAREQQIARAAFTANGDMDLRRSSMNSYTPGKPVGGDSSDERLWAMLCHLSTFAGYFVPVGNILGPLVVWLIKKDQYALVDDQGKEALNFQISVLIYGLISFVLCFVLIGFVLLIALIIFDLVVTIMAAVQANSGVYYRYPMCIRLIT
jgi:uncharacterized Tic20 family protein